jgi:hypothetical protein
MVRTRLRTITRAPTSINIDSVLWREFKSECAKAKRTVTDQMERMIGVWIISKQRTHRK